MSFMFFVEETIVAIATALGSSGINIIRISGPEAKNISREIFFDKFGNKKKEFNNKYLNYGTIRDKSGKIIDEVLLTFMKKPHTFTREDIVEINCHGGVISAKKIIELLLTFDCRLAERGEFTKRAFLNGRIDLTQAEAVIDVINSKTEKNHEISIGHLEGRLSSQINKLIEKIIELLANIEVNIDFPEYDEDIVTIEKVKTECTEMREIIRKLINSADTGKIYKEGINTLIIGKPNVGKSSVMNFLLNENRAIVTDIPGTTRDTIEEQLNVNGIPLNIIDTAGIRKTDDMVEKIGVEKAISKIDEADLILMVLDSSRALDDEDREILSIIKDKKVIYIENKIDLDRKIELDNFENITEIVNISALKNQGLEDLTKAVEKMFFSGKINSEEDLIINSARQKKLLVQADGFLKEVLNCVENGMSIDFIEIDLKNAMESLGLITGKAVSDDLVDKIFSDFCIGK